MSLTAKSRCGGEEFSNDGRDRAYRAKREINDWDLDWTEPDFEFARLSERIKVVIDDAISLLSNLRHRIDPELLAETEASEYNRKNTQG